MAANLLNYLPKAWTPAPGVNDLLTPRPGGIGYVAPTAPTTPATPTTTTTPAPGINTPVTPTASASNGVPAPPQFLNQQNQDLANIAYILNPNFDTSETENRAAEQNFASGLPMSGFGSGTTAKLLESEKLARFKLGHELLTPYLERETSERNLATANQARLNEIAAEGAQALQRLQLSEAGQTARLSQSEAARLQEIALQGNQAMAELQARVAADKARLEEQLTANRDIARLNLAGDLIKIGFNNTGGSAGSLPNQVAPRGTNITGTGQVGALPVGMLTPTGYSNGIPYYNNSNVGPRPVSSGFNFNTVDNILRRYGIT